MLKRSFTTSAMLILLTLLNAAILVESADVYEESEEEPVSFLTEEEADQRAQQIMNDCERMKLKFGDENFNLADLDRDFKDKTGIVIGRNTAGDEILVFVPIRPNETPRRGAAEVHITRKGEDTLYYFSERPVKVKVTKRDLYTVTGTFYEENRRKSGRRYNLDLFYGYSLGLKGDVDLKMNPDDPAEAFLSGTLGSQIFQILPQFYAKHSQLKTIVMMDIPGSNADRYNTLAGARLRRLGLNTKILKDSEIHSGGVDLYAAGVKRFAERGATVGVHSWCCDKKGREGWQLPRGHKEHAYYVNYLSDMLGERLGTEFYYYTVNAARSDKIHKMPWIQMRKFGLVTDEVVA